MASPSERMAQAEARLAEYARLAASVDLATASSDQIADMVRALELLIIEAGAARQATAGDLAEAIRDALTPGRVPDAARLRRRRRS